MSAMRAQRMIFLRNRLADFELHVALYYMRRGCLCGRHQSRQVLRRELRTVHRRCAAP